MTLGWGSGKDEDGRLQDFCLLHTADSSNIFDSYNGVALFMPLGPPTPSVPRSSLQSCVGQQILRAQAPWWALVWVRHMASVQKSHPANIPGECHPLACPLLLGAGAAATQGVPSHDARAQGLRALQAVAPGGGKAALGEAALAAGQHSSGGHDTRWGLLPQPAVQVLNFLLL